jgi:hypothetical protein
VRVRTGALVALLSATVLVGCGGGSGTASDETQGNPPGSNGSGFEGGERDVEEFGDEAQGSEKEAVLSAERGYLQAIATKRYDQACANLSRAVMFSMQHLTQSTGGNPGCPAILPKLLAAGAAGAAFERQLKGQVARVRVEGRQAFVVFHAPGARLWVMPMSREDGGWRAATISATVLAPSATTLGE